MERLTLFSMLGPVLVALVICCLAIVIIAVVVGVIVWGLRRGQVRVVKNERNFDNFGH